MSSTTEPPPSGESFRFEHWDLTIEPINQSRVPLPWDRSVPHVVRIILEKSSGYNLNDVEVDYLLDVYPDFVEAAANGAGKPFLDNLRGPFLRFFPIHLSRLFDGLPGLERRVGLWESARTLPMSDWAVLIEQRVFEMLRYLMQLLEKDNEDLAMAVWWDMIQSPGQPSHSTTAPGIPCASTTFPSSTAPGLAPHCHDIASNSPASTRADWILRSPEKGEATSSCCQDYASFAIEVAKEVISSSDPSLSILRSPEAFSPPSTKEPRRSTRNAVKKQCGCC